MKIATRTNVGWRQWKGLPYLFIRGHNPVAGEQHGNWHGDQADYSAVHAWVRRHYEKSGVCESCGAQGRTDWSNVSGEYRRLDRSDWIELCRRCHLAVDREDPKRPNLAGGPVTGSREAR